MIESSGINDVVMYHDLVEGYNIVNGKKENIAIMKFYATNEGEDYTFMLGSGAVINYCVELEEFALNIAFETDRSFRAYQYGYKLTSYIVDELSFAKRLSLVHNGLLLSDLCKDNSFLIHNRSCTENFLPHLDYDKFFINGRLKSEYLLEDRDD